MRNLILSFLKGYWLQNQCEQKLSFLNSPSPKKSFPAHPSIHPSTHQICNKCLLPARRCCRQAEAAVHRRSNFPVYPELTFEWGDGAQASV